MDRRHSSDELRGSDLRVRVPRGQLRHGRHAPGSEGSGSRSREEEMTAATNRARRRTLVAALAAWIAGTALLAAQAAPAKTDWLTAWSTSHHTLGATVVKDATVR